MQLHKCQEISIGLWQICQIANIILTCHIPLSHHVIGLQNYVPVLKTVPTSSATGRQGKEGNVDFTSFSYRIQLSSKIKVGQVWLLWKLHLDIESSQFTVIQKCWLLTLVWSSSMNAAIKSQSRLYMTGRNIHLLDAELLNSSSEKKVGGWMECARGETWPADHRILPV